jgi:holo-[acyl-carrier protein] synthase
MIVGVGIDLIELGRFKAAMKRQGAPLLDKLFTAAERRYCEGKWNRIAHYAARFAAKEAVLKALGTGWSGGIHWTDVEVARDGAGAVTVRLTGQAKKAAAKRKIRRIHLNITHAEHYAAAVAIAET